jgi:hypothetical protein
MAQPAWTKSIAAGLAVAPAVGLPAANFVPPSLYSAALASVTRNTPAGAPSWYANQAQICLIARGLITWHNVPGDCASPGTVDFSGESDAEGAAGIGIGIASMAGASLPGIGSAISLVTSFIEHHPEAVALEQNVSCAVAGTFNQVIAYYDNQVRKGLISPAQAVAGVRGYCQQAKGQLAQIAKTSCDWGCELTGIVAAHADFLVTYYPAIAPVQFSAHAPGGAPAVSGTAPGGVVQVGTQIPSPSSSAIVVYPGGNSVVGVAAAGGLSGMEKLILLALLAGVGGYVAYEATR